MMYPGDVPRAVDVMTAAAAAASSSSPSPPAHRPLAFGGKPRSRHPIAPFRAAWANQRLLQCSGVDGDGSALVAAPASSQPAPSTARKSAGSGDDGFERIRAKLMDHLREAVGRIELPAVSPGEERSSQPAVAPPAPVEEADDRGGHKVSPTLSSSPASAVAVHGASAPAAAAVEELPWNLRTRKSIVSCNGRQPSQHQIPGPSSLTPSPAPSPLAKPASRLRSGAPERSRRRRPRFSVPLTKDEIDEDLYAFTGRRASRRPKKRPRIVQKQLDMMFPGLWLSEVTVDIYHVADPPPPLS